MAMKYVPHPYQKYAIDRVINEPSVGLLLDMGLGKTVITLSAISELIQLGQISKVLIIAPKRVSEATWQTEGRKWDNTNWLRFSTVLGSAKERLKALEAEAEVYVINRENVQWLCEQYSPRDWPFDMIVFDESSSFKNPAAKRFKSIKRMLPFTNRKIILTGTPAPNGMEDIWSQVYLLDSGARLGKYISHYREKYFDFNQWRHEYKLKRGAYDTIQKHISDICVSMKAEDWLQLPELVVEDFPVRLDKAAQKAYSELKTNMVLELENQEDLTALTAAALTNKLLQFCGGAAYDDERGVHVLHDLKTSALTELLESLNGENALVFYGYQHEKERIREACLKVDRMKPEMIRELQDARDVEDWNAGKIRVLIAHPASTAYGLNLQAGGHHTIWYTITWNLELYQQANARLHRQGQQYPTVIHRLLVQDTVDYMITQALEDKASVQSILISELKAKIGRC